MKWICLFTACLAAGLAADRATAGEDSLLRGYVSEPVLLLRAEDVLRRALPYRTALKNGAVVQSSQLQLACLGVARFPQDLLVYLPATNTCLGWSALAMPALRARLGAGSDLSLGTDMPGIERSLNDGKLVVIEPRGQVRPPFPVCVCPPGVDPIFSDGFESDPAL